MSLTASMWSSVSGLIVHGERMNVIGNNIANINTVGFKAARMDFEDFFYQDTGTAAGNGQLGRGAGIGIIMNDFSASSHETTKSSTDLAIGGNGFFKVIPKGDNTEYYTRAGNFLFDKNGYLTDPHGYVLQGWKVDNTSSSLLASTGSTASNSTRIAGSGTPTDVQLDKFSCDPRHTSQVQLAANLDSQQGLDKSSDEDYPFFSLLRAWDATPDANGNIMPLGSEKYAWPCPIDVFDEAGRSHTLTIYFDRVTQTNATNIDNLGSNIVWEFIVTMDPTDDIRNFTTDPTDLLPSKYKGLLMAGTLTFDSGGTNLKDMAAYVPSSNDMGNLNNWVQAPLSSTGLPVFCPNFTGRTGASNPWDSTKTPPVINPLTSGYLIEMNFGINSTSPSWDPSMPATAAAWTDLISSGGYQNEYKVLKGEDKKPLYYQKSVNLTPPSDYPATLSLPGLASIPAWSSLDHSNPPPIGQVVGSDNLVYQQKKASQGLKEGEASDASGWVWVQITGTQTGTGLTGYQFSGNDGKTYIYANGKYYNANDATDLTGQTAAQLNAAGITVSAVPDTSSASNRISTTTPVYYDTPPNIVPKFKLDSLNNPIQATTSSLEPGMGPTSVTQDTSCTSYDGKGKNGFTEYTKRQDGYTYGTLRNVSVSQDGILSGSYSNGVVLDLFQLTLYDFPSKQNLRREGGNLFTETRDSGQPLSGAANTGSFGPTKMQSLEQSNVDLSREFVYMIATQKGFQANSKTITTVDTMLDTVIAMKR